MAGDDRRNRRTGNGSASGVDRRGFLRRSAWAGAGGLALGAAPGLTRSAAALADPPRVQRSVRLGRTGLEVSDIGFGAGRLRGSPELVRHALDRGITYFDTAEGYGGGRSETTIGEALGERRNDVTLVSKVKAGSDERVASLMERLDASLQRLRTDRVEIYLNHAVNDVARIRNPEWWEFTERAKEAGKIRFTGLSGHAGRLAECIDWALERDLLDVLLVAYNFGQDPTFAERFTGAFDFVATQPRLPELLEKAKAKDVGVVAMKTLLGAKLNDMRPYEAGGATFAQAAFRWVLGSPNVDNLIISMKSTADIDEYLGASGWTKPAPGDRALLERYLAINGATQCRFGCGDCREACPAGVEISDVLRTRMYSVDYGEHDQARREYASLAAAGADAAACLTCDGAPCRDACSHGLDIAALAEDAHRRLS